LIGILSGKDIAVPHFYFDVREGARFVPDEIGLEFDNLDAAERAAAETAAEIGRELLPKGDAREVTVELKNKHRQRVLTVTVSLEIHRVDPPPQPRARETCHSIWHNLQYGTGVRGRPIL
jgi:hypothetical protein